MLQNTVSYSNQTSPKLTVLDAPIATSTNTLFILTNSDKYART